MTDLSIREATKESRMINSGCFGNLFVFICRGRRLGLVVTSDRNRKHTLFTGRQELAKRFEDAGPEGREPPGSYCLRKRPFSPKGDAEKLSPL